MNHRGRLQSINDPEEALERLCAEAATRVNRERNLTETERALLICVLGIREFGRFIRESMNENGEIVAGFDERVSSPVMIPGDEVWGLTNELTERVLDGIGVLERFDPEAAAIRQEVRAYLESL